MNDPMAGRKKKISIVSPCFNEEENVEELYKRVVNVMAKVPDYEFEYIFIDNASTDRTVSILEGIASRDSRLKIIVNNRNFGHIRSPYWGILQGQGDATIFLASDLQDPPDLILQFIQAWEAGAKVVLGVKPRSNTNRIIHRLRRMYYYLLDKISEVPLIRDATGFGLYDKSVIDCFRDINDPYPYLRGLVCELGFSVHTIVFDQPKRERGLTKNNFYSLYDVAMLGIISHSVVPIRLAAFIGLITGALSIVTAFIFFALKIFHWSSFPVGVAPLIIGIFFMFGVILLFIGLLGEYIASIHTYVRNRPIVVERRRINF